MEALFSDNKCTDRSIPGLKGPKRMTSISGRNKISLTCSLFKLNFFSDETAFDEHEVVDLLAKNIAIKESKKFQLRKDSTSSILRCLAEQKADFRLSTEMSRAP